MVDPGPRLRREPLQHARRDQYIDLHANAARICVPMLDRLRALTPRQFENVVFDLVASAGLVNAVWRTPGADQGRDIEGIVHRVDFSGEYTVEKWYVECKRYEGSLDWPTVWEKLAYADSHQADYLLLVTTGTLSPQCKTEVGRWNSGRRAPQARFWDATTMEAILLQHPLVIARHSLTDTMERVTPAFLDLSRQTAKYVQAAFGRASIGDAVSPELESAAASAELLTARLEGFQTAARFLPTAFVLDVDGYEWLDIEGDQAALSGYDRYGIRAILTLIRHSQRIDRVLMTVETNSILVDIDHPLYDAAIDALRTLAVWANVEMVVSDTTVLLRHRTER